MKLRSRTGKGVRFSLRKLANIKLFRKQPDREPQASVSLRERLKSLHLFAGRKTITRPPAPVFMVVITPKAEAFFQLRADGAVDVDRSALPSEGAVIFLFEGGDDAREKADLRMESPKGTSYRASKERMLEEIATRARMFQAPAYPSIIYGRNQRSLAAYGQNIVIPGPSVIDHLVPPSTDQAWIIPLVLTDRDDRTAAVVMLPVLPGKDGNASTHERLQLTKQPGVDTKTLIEGFAEQAARKNKEFAKAGVIEVTAEDLIRLSTTLPSYPLENEVFGVPASSVFRYGAVAAGVVASVSVAGNVVMGLEAGYLRISANQATSERDQLSQKVDHAFSTRVRSLARAMSVDVDGTVKAAQGIWQPDSLVAVDCTTKGCSLRLTANLNRGNTFGVDTSAQLVSSVLDKESLNGILMQAPPLGYRKKEVAITGDGNVITVVFEHQNPDSPARKLLPR